MTTTHRYARVSLAAIAAITVGLLCIRAGLGAALPATMAAGNRLVGMPPALVFKAVRQAVVTDTPKSDLLAASIEASRSAPLAEEPFLLAANSAFESGNNAKAQTLLEESLQRNPRLRQARLLLLERYARTGDASGMAAQLLALLRLDPELTKAFTSSLAQLIIAPDTRAVTIRAIRGTNVVEGVLDEMMTANADPALVLAVADRALKSEPSAASPPWQVKLIRELVARGDFARAKSQWTRFTPAATYNGTNEIYNPAFADNRGSPPFNWNFPEGDTGVAEPGGGGSLEAVFYGRKSGELASQLLTLKPGRYNLSMEASGDAPQDGSTIEWQLICDKATQPLGTLSLDRISPDGSPVMRPISVPSGCSAQWLKLVGYAGDIPRTRIVTISKLKLDRVR